MLPCSLQGLATRWLANLPGREFHPLDYATLPGRTTGAFWASPCSRARLSHSVSAASKLAATLVTLALLAGGVALAARYGDFSMRAGDRMKMEADSGQSREAAKPPFEPQSFVIYGNNVKYDRFR